MFTTQQRRQTFIHSQATCLAGTRTQSSFLVSMPDPNPCPIPNLAATPVPLSPRQPVHPPKPGVLRGLIASLMCPVSARASKEDLGPYSSSRGTDWRLKSGDGELAGGDCLAPRLPLVHSCGHARPIASHATVRISLRHRCRHARPIASHATPRASLRRRCRRARPIASHATL